MTSILSEIIDRKRQVVTRLRADPASRDFRQCALEIRADAVAHRLLRALESDSPGPNIIAEFKRRSPSAGIIHSDLSATEVVRCYERGGACAISVLTDEEYFGGSIADLSAVCVSTSLPILRKDFIIDPIQVYEAALAGADAALLIAAALDDATLSELRGLTEDELGLDALVEVHTSEELRRAVNVVFRRLAKWQDFFLWSAATAQTKACQQKRGGHDLHEVPAGDRVGQFAGARRKLAFHPLTEFGRVSQMIQAAPIFRPRLGFRAGRGNRFAHR